MSSGVMCEKDQQQYECNDSHAIYNLHFTNKSERYEALAHSPQFNQQNRRPRNPWQTTLLSLSSSDIEMCRTVFCGQTQRFSQRYAHTMMLQHDIYAKCVQQCNGQLINHNGKLTHLFGPWLGDTRNVCEAILFRILPLWQCVIYAMDAPAHGSYIRCTQCAI